MKIEQVQPGDVIRTNGGKGIKVETVTQYACSTYGTHVNDRFCWDRGSDVSVSKYEELVEV